MFGQLRIDLRIHARYEERRNRRDLIDGEAGRDTRLETGLEGGHDLSIAVDGEQKLNSAAVRRSIGGRPASVAGTLISVFGRQRRAQRPRA